ncbi:hypothetical protein ACPOLB_11190 [Rubrivivax sp. RP6-9]|uniref:hypothetical protein n=1 Tax=Rubrivivax sp. RP6-9 TaxID=3415750 RepID=UPI003CC51872
MADALPATPASRRRPGPGGAFLLVLATLVTAHMPVVVGMGYAPWNAEVLLSLAALAGVAALAAALLYRVPLLLHVFACFWVYWALDAYLPDTAVTRSLAWAMALTGTDLQPTTWQWLLCLLPPAVVVVLLSTRVADNVRAMLLTFACVWSLGLWWSPDRALLQDDTPAAVPAPAPATTAAALRPLLHIILDEQTSIRALTAALPPDHPAQRIAADYLDRGFDYHAQVGAPSGRTQKSLAATMELDETPQPEHLHNHHRQRFRHTMPENRYFATLQALGYRVHVVQSSFLRLCPPDSPAHCQSYLFGKTGPVGPHLQATPASRLAVLVLELHRAYTHPDAYPVRAYAALYATLQRWNLDQSYEYVYYSNPVAALNLMAGLEQRMRAIAPGEAHVVHLLMPHFPYMTRPDCSIKPLAAWSSPNRHLAPGEAPRPLPQLERDYWDQAACTHRRVLALIDQARAASPLDPIVIVHGDHGPRLQSSYDNLDSTDAGDSDLLATFVAVHDRPAGPRQAGVERGERQSLPAVFGAFVARLQTTAAAAVRPAAQQP